MVTQEENDMMTRVGPGTPAGELLRRYWHPVSAAAELTDEEPIRRVRIMCEDLVLYRDKSGGYGLVAEQCPHRRASLAYGKVDAEGIRCPYHGWKFAPDGRCLEQPAESPDSRLKDEIRHTAYPVRRLGGLLFAYMGPLPAPALPHWDVLAWSFGKRWILKFSTIECNWLQAVENAVDSSHVYWLHGASTDLGYDRYKEEHEFVPFEYGIMKRRLLPPKQPGGPKQVDQHPLLFPSTLRHVLGKTPAGAPEKSRESLLNRGGAHGFVHDLQFRVPIDDSHTLSYLVFFQASETERMSPDDDVPMAPFPMRNEDGKYRLDKVFAQDVMAWETQGPILDRTRECLGASDIGIVKLRRMLTEQIKIVQNGGTPMGTVAADQESDLIELDVIRDRHGLVKPERQKAS
jgi:5,5'-dehydrodivanillate O-demethylase